jgi:phage terminase small subunit
VRASALRGKVLSSVDITTLATYCQMWARFVEAEKAKKPVSPSYIAQMNILAGKLGLSPADRCRIRLEPEAKPTNRFQKLGRK